MTVLDSLYFALLMLFDPSVVGIVATSKTWSESHVPKVPLLLGSLGLSRSNVNEFTCLS